MDIKSYSKDIRDVCKKVDIPISEVVVESAKALNKEGYFLPDEPLFIFYVNNIIAEHSDRKIRVLSRKKIAEKAGVPLKKFSREFNEYYAKKKYVIVHRGHFESGDLYLEFERDKNRKKIRRFEWAELRKLLEKSGFDFGYN